MGYEFGFVPLDMDVSASVNSVFGRTGAVAASVGDYSAAQVTNAANLAAVGTQTFAGPIQATSASVSGSLAALTLNAGTGTFTNAVTASSASVSGALTGATLASGTGTFTSTITASSASVSGALTGSSLVLTGTTGPQFTSLGLGIAAASVTGSYATTPPASASVSSAVNGSLAVGTPFQNKLSYDINMTVFLSVTVNTSGTIALGVGPTSTPATVNIVSGVTTVGFIAVKFKIPTQYFALLSISGTITDSIAGQFVEAA